MDQCLTDEAQEYLTLRCEEEMVKLRLRMVEEKRQEATLAVNATQLVYERTSEVERTTWKRILLPPLLCPIPHDASNAPLPIVALPFHSLGNSLLPNSRLPSLENPDHDPFFPPPSKIFLVHSSLNFASDAVVSADAALTQTMAPPNCSTLPQCRLYTDCNLYIAHQFFFRLCSIFF